MRRNSTPTGSTDQASPLKSSRNRFPRYSLPDNRFVKQSCMLVDPERDEQPKHRRPSRVLHFADGILEEYSDHEDEEEMAEVEEKESLSELEKADKSVIYFLSCCLIL